MTLPQRDVLPPWALSLLNRIETMLIAAMAILLPFDHWFFGHLVNPAPMRVLGFVLTAVWLLQCATRQIRFRFEIWHGFLAIFLVICFYSAFASPAIPDTRINNFQYKLIATAKIVAAMLFLVLASQALDMKKILVFLRVHLLIGVTICTASLVMYMLHVSRLWPNGFMLWVEPDIYMFVRLQGVSYEPHRFGAYTMTLLPWLLLPELRRCCGWSNGFALAALSIVFLCLLLSFAVGTFVALPLLLLLLIYHSRANFSSMLKVALGLAIMIAVMSKIPVVYDSILEIIEVKSRSQSLSDRLYHWKIAIIQSVLYPWTGVGPESYSYFLATLNPALANATPATNPPQNMLLGITANTGLPGIASFLAFLFTFLVAYVMRYRKSDAGKLVSYAGFAIACSHFVYQQSIWLPWSLNQWLFMAIAWAALSPRNNMTKAAS